MKEFLKQLLDCGWFWVGSSAILGIIYMLRTYVFPPDDKK